MFRTWPLTLFSQCSFKKTFSISTVTGSLLLTLTKYEHHNNYLWLFKSIGTAPCQPFNWMITIIQMMMLMSNQGRQTIQTLRCKKFSTTPQVESYWWSGKKLTTFNSCKKSCQMSQEFKSSKKYLISWSKKFWCTWRKKTNAKLWWQCCSTKLTEARLKNWSDVKVPLWQCKITSKSLKSMTKVTSMRPKRFWEQDCSKWWTKDGFSTRPCTPHSEKGQKMCSKRASY